MTASRTWRSRSFRDATISPKLLPTNNLDHSPGAGQVTDERVEAKPALGRTHDPLPLQLYPLLTPPGGEAVGRTSSLRQSHIGPQREIEALQFPLVLGQDFLGVDRRQSGPGGAPIGLPRGQIPATHPAVERMRRGTEAQIGATRPVGRVVARAVAVAFGVRDLVEAVAVASEPLVRVQVLLRIALVVGRRGGAARDPAGQRGPFLDGEPIEGEVSREQGAGEVQVARPVALELRRKRENEIE